MTCEECLSALATESIREINLFGYLEICYGRIDRLCHREPQKSINSGVMVHQDRRQDNARLGRPNTVTLGLPRRLR